MKICPLGAELFHAGRQAGRHDEANSRFFDFTNTPTKGIKWGSGSHIYIDSKKAYDSFRREVLCNTLPEFGIPLKLVRWIKMCLILVTV
jgi:hypothetical protein